MTDQPTLRDMLAKRLNAALPAGNNIEEWKTHYGALAYVARKSLTELDSLTAELTTLRADRDAVEGALRVVFLHGHSEGWTGNQTRRDVQHVDAEKGWSLYVSNGALEKTKARHRIAATDTQVSKHSELAKEIADALRTFYGAGRASTRLNRHLTDSRFSEEAARIAALRQAPDAQVSSLVSALEWYANPEVYKPHPHGLAFDDRDLSWKARAALDGMGSKS